MNIAFYWQGVTGRYGVWRDGLYAAMKEIEKRGHTVTYLEPGVDAPIDTDVILSWEAPCTLNGQNADKYRSVMAQPYPKALLFAGGPVRPDICHGFDLYFVESKISEEEFGALGLPWKRAFGVNTQIFKPEPQPKKFLAFMQATYAAWKRHTLFAEALGMEGVTAGRKQEHEKFCYEACEKAGVLTLPEVSPEVCASLINASDFVLNTAEYWGGGQRCTLEAMACGVPPVVMTDSPKNREYVEESGFGIVCEPSAPQIYEIMYSSVGGFSPQVGIDYIHSKWTEFHYADALLEGISQIV
jgi:hypothetical protein